MMIDDGSPLNQLLRCCSSWPRLSHGYYALLTIILNKGTKKRKNIPVRNSQLLQGNSAVGAAPGVFRRDRFLERGTSKGTLRVGGIIRHTSITLEAAHRTLLPNDHPVPSLP
ncbi:hypothetical protein P5673_032321 [Acropora cervicornis]|uniref:Uncharacterized protein n=1 Tax=Acropora cervicornis TaxID=6130 RepID=A0AAD9PRN7_ACRCE|nr:hypothetical protein P5673_032321 [Acropora cervicornis]